MLNHKDPIGAGAFNRAQEVAKHDFVRLMMYPWLSIDLEQFSKLPEVKTKRNTAKFKIKF